MLTQRVRIENTCIPTVFLKENVTESEGEGVSQGGALSLHSTLIVEVGVERLGRLPT